MHTFTRFCESRRRFSLSSPLNIYISLFYLCLSDLSLLPACCRAPPRSPPPLPRRVAIRAPLSSLPAFPPLVLRSCSCRVFRGCRAVCPLSFSPFVPIGHAPKLSGGLPSCLLCLVVLWWLPSLVHRQAQNGVTVWADAARIYPRPCLLLPMFCRVFRCPFRVLSCGLSCLLSCVVWW